MRHGLLDALLDCGDVVARDRSANHSVVELKAGATRQRGHTEIRHCELAVATGLLLDPTNGLGRSDNGLAVRHANGGGIDVDAELAGQALDRHRHMRVAHATQHGLTRLLHPFDQQHRVLGLQAGQRIAELVVVGLGARHDCNPILRNLAGRSHHGDRRALRGQGIARERGAELGHGGDVASGHLGQRRLFPATQGEQAMEALVRPATAVDQAVVGSDASGQHLEDRQLAHERVGNGLEHVGQRWAGGVGQHRHDIVAGHHPGRAVGR
ncbi:unannotated protein [freshwater metagenome]|uniref:Unannotated protein n=1 Tax=freshwater metagenome TaxID=449393 RepID=A0A6J7EFJ7_9ZZZZ